MPFYALFSAFSVRFAKPVLWHNVAKGGDVMYGFNNGYGYSNMQSGLGYNQPYNANIRPVGNAIKGYMVTNAEEARAAQIDFDGTVSYFPCPAENRIYAKSIGMNGMPVFMVYEIPKQQPAPAYADGAYVNALAKRVEKMEKCLQELGMGVSDNDTTNGNANVK